MNNNIISLRHELHRCAELSMQEKETAELIKRFLRRNTDFEIIEMEHGFYAVKKAAGSVKAADKAAIAFRAELDALPMDESIDLSYASEHPGVAHKCGHDGHCAVLCAMAVTLSESKVKDPGRDVYMIFQPAEETGEGAKICRTLLKEKNIREIYAFHNMSGFEEGKIVYRYGITQPASEGLKIIFKGKVSHASAPDEGNNPASALAEIVLCAEKLSDETDSDAAFCTVSGIDLGNGDYGISPGSGSISITLRAESSEKVRYFEKSLRTYAQGLAEKGGFAFDWETSDFFPETVNDEECLRRVIEAAADLGMESEEMTGMWAASEDFAYYLQECPGAMVYIGNGIDYPPVHTSKYDFNDGIIQTAEKLLLELI